MKTIFILFALMISLSSLAQEITCLEKLLPYNRYSGVHQVTKDEWTDGKEILDADGAKTALIFLTNSKLLCRPNEIVIKVAPVCGQQLTDLPQSNSCFVFTNVGYFIISRDFGRNTNFIFSKDKKFSDPSKSE